MRPNNTHSPHTIVVGLQYGDEGKGQIVDMLAADHDVVVRFNGGANSGHTVEIAGERFKLHLVPSGILAPNTRNVIGNGVALDPWALLAEIDSLEQRSVDVRGRLWISSRAHLVLPYHRAWEALIESAALRFGGVDAVIGSTGKGIGPAYADKALRSTAIRAGDLLDAGRLRSQLRISAAVKNAMLGSLASLVESPFQPIDAEQLARCLMEAAERLRPFITDTARLLRNEDASGKRILFEGAHSAMLDVDHGTYPFVSASGCTPLAAPAGSGIPLRGRARVVGVVKAYTSRVGAGPFPTEITGDTAERLRRAGSEFGTTTGRPRRIGWLNLADVRDMAELCGVDVLALTGIGPLGALERISVATTGSEVIEMEGWSSWQESIKACAHSSDLPEPIQHVIGYVETVAPVGWVSLGRSRQDILTR
jgi:adenylosuccinate synthase